MIADFEDESFKMVQFKAKFLTVASYLRFIFSKIIVEGI